jgi:hypothetical protein
MILVECQANLEHDSPDVSGFRAHGRGTSKPQRLESGRNRMLGCHQLRVKVGKRFRVIRYASH